MKFKIKRVLITGAAQGIGFAIADKLAQEGIPVILSDLNQEAVLKAAEEISLKHQLSAVGVKLDVSNETEIKTVISELNQEYGPIDGLVNNAGICCPAKPLDEISSAEWNKVFHVNVLGMVYCTCAVVAEMKKQGFGRIVNMSSSSGFTGGISVSASYAVCKAGVMALTKNMAKQYGPCGITVNALSPGIISTEMTKDLSYDITTLALQRFGEREEVADLAAFLLSEESSYITGSTVDINGGLYMR